MEPVQFSYIIQQILLPAVRGCTLNMCRMEMYDMMAFIRRYCNVFIAP